MKIPPYRPEIRFADIDAMGHVNNAIYFTYFEQARIHFFRHLNSGKWDWTTAGVLVARNEIDYKSPVLLNDEIDIHVFCTHLGQKSFTIGYALKRGDQICTTGQTVLVCFNHKDQTTQPIPDIWRAQLSELKSE